MIKNFSQVKDNLYRGAAPSVIDLINLSKNYGIQQIISLDKKCGEEIAPFCNKLGIDQTIIDINPGNITSIRNLLSYNINDLFKNDVPTFVHCRRGKDRAGLLIALERCILEKWDCKKAIKEAKLLGFGTGLDYPVEKFYTKLIKKSCPNEHVDNNEAYDIVSNVSDNNSMYRDEQLDPYGPSFAPFADKSYRTYPGSFVDLKPYDEQYSTRENYGLKGINDTEEVGNIEIPSVGEYDQNSQITNIVGPSIIGGGFV